MSSPSAARRLLDWYRSVARDLPWRRTQDPYAIWVSEVMLQQTRVETAERYFVRFLQRFPTIQSLAGATEEDVLATWSGLGYYRRARQLHSAARAIAAQGGEIPRTATDLRALPGVGAYTAAAVASIAFGERVAVMDGNVERVTARLLAEGRPPKSAEARRRLQRAAEELIDPASPGDSNQALMELGATLCSPRNPRCGDCPLRVECRASQLGEAERYPVAPARSAVVGVRAAAVVFEDCGRVLLRRRSDTATFLPGTWEPPWVQLGDLEDPRAALLREVPGLVAQGLLGRVTHGITFRRFSVEVYGGGIEPLGQVAEVAGERLISAVEFAELPTSALARKILATAGFQ
jgi:A/G-specific adenine glycosylase